MRWLNEHHPHLILAERRTLKRASSASKRPPLFQSKELLSKICTHMKDSLLITTELVVLELDGLPFRRKDVTILAQVRDRPTHLRLYRSLTIVSKGIAKCKSLVHFRLTNSPIGDEGLDSKTCPFHCQHKRKSRAH